MDQDELKSLESKWRHIIGIALRLILIIGSIIIIIWG